MCQGDLQLRGRSARWPPSADRITDACRAARRSLLPSGAEGGSGVRGRRARPELGLPWGWIRVCGTRSEPPALSWPAGAGRGTPLVSTGRPRATGGAAKGVRFSLLPRQPERPPPPTQLMWGDIPPEMAAPRTPAPGSTVQGPGSCHAGSRAPLLDLVTQGPPDTENRVTSSHEPRDLGGAHPRGPGFPPGLWGQGAADCRSGSVQAAPRLRPRCWVSPCLPLALVSAHLPCPPPTPPHLPRARPSPSPSQVTGDTSCPGGAAGAWGHWA